MDSAQNSAMEQAERMRSWMSRQYLIPGRQGHASVRLDASIGCSEYREGDNMQQLLERADAALCAERNPAEHRRTA
jgi:PleD family two-component response regulator